MPEEQWFLFDLGNTVIKLAYERVLQAICADSAVKRDDLVDLLEDAGGYRDMERGAVTFWEFYEFLCDKAGYRGDIRAFHSVWSDFFDGPMPGIEEVLERVRKQYRLKQYPDRALWCSVSVGTSPALSAPLRFSARSSTFSRTADSLRSVARPNHEARTLP